MLLALAATGYERGTITPLGSTTAWPVVVDETIPGRRVSMGAGEHGRSLFVNADRLIEAFDVVKPTVPFVVRLDGTNDVAGRKLLADADLPNVHTAAEARNVAPLAPSAEPLELAPQQYAGVDNDVLV